MQFFSTHGTNLDIKREETEAGEIMRTWGQGLSLWSLLDASSQQRSSNPARAVSAKGFLSYKPALFKRHHQNPFSIYRKKGRKKKP